MTIQTVRTIQTVVDRWVKQALHDLESAKKNMEIGVYDVCLVLCEQAAEKMLKALYIKTTGKEFPPKIHSLEKLMALVGMQDELCEMILELDDYYCALRYPDIAEEMPYELCNKDDANDGVEKAEEIINIVSERILTIGG
ncbi:MAG: HEPN domain-containing protein [Candidatus Desantisbacteria bacterium]